MNSGEGDMVEFAVLDLVPVSEGKTPADALRNARDLAQHVERWGYKRYLFVNQQSKILHWSS